MNNSELSNLNLNTSPAEFVEQVNMAVRLETAFPSIGPKAPAIFYRNIRFSRPSIGFMPRSKLIHRLYNSLIALALILILLPLLIVIAMILLLTQGRPIFYTGTRIGESGKRFDIYKFRTLDTNKAMQLTRDCVLPPGTGIETPVGLFLRETRLDEIPQLFNVLRGDMNLCGPRPVRPEIAEVHRVGIPEYDVRFRVKPGLIGPGQALMYHGTSKAIRSRLNNHYCRSPLSYWGELSLIFIVAACVVARTVEQMIQLTMPVPRYQELIQNQKRAKLYNLTFQTEGHKLIPVRWIDSNHISLEGAGDWDLPVSGRLFMTLLDGKLRSLRIKIGPVSAQGSGCCNSYRPESDFGEHVLSRYFFQKVVVPHRSEFLASRLRRGFRKSRFTDPVS